jgi:hypothetical protein
MCTSTISSGLQTALNNAVGGNVICLNAGSYGDISLSSKSYASDVIVRPVAGATATIGSVTLSSVAHLRLSGLGGTLQSGSTRVSGSSRSITFDHIVHTACMRFDGTSSSSNILVDHDRLDNLGVGLAGCNMGEGRIQVEGSTGQANGWLVISNTHFGGQAGGAGDCSDGIQLGGTDGVIVGPGNEFTGITQGSCGAHADAIQFYGGHHVTITGNYFHANKAGITNYDNGSGPYTVTNNVLVGPFYAGAGGIMIVGCDGCIARHNTIVNAVNQNLGCGKGHTGPDSTNTIIDGNVLDGGYVNNSPTCQFTATYNLNSGLPGTGNINGTPLYVSSPASGYYHYQLAPGSPGYHAASDGKSMGIAP